MAKAKTGKTTGRKRAKTAGGAAGPKWLNKLTIKTVCGEVVFPDGSENGDEILLMTVYGEARDYSQKEGTHGLWTAFLGDFRAMRASDGVTFQSAKVFVPNAATELVIAAIQEMKRNADVALKAGHAVPTGGVQFALQIGATMDDTIKVGYQYSCEPLLNRQSDVLGSIESQISDKLKLLTKS